MTGEAEGSFTPEAILFKILKSVCIQVRRIPGRALLEVRVKLHRTRKVL